MQNLPPAKTLHWRIRLIEFIWIHNAATIWDWRTAIWPARPATEKQRDTMGHTHKSIKQSSSLKSISPNPVTQYISLMGGITGISLFPSPCRGQRVLGDERQGRRIWRNCQGYYQFTSISPSVPLSLFFYSLFMLITRRTGPGKLRLRDKRTLRTVKRSITGSRGKDLIYW